MFLILLAIEISEYQEEKDKMMALQQQVALMEEDLTKEKGRVAGKVMVTVMCVYFRLFRN